MRNPILETKLFVLALVAIFSPEILRYMVIADFMLYGVLCIIEDAYTRISEESEDNM